MLDGVSPRAGLLGSGAIVVMACLSTAAFAAGDAQPLYTEIPGSLEFSGRLIARIKPGLNAARDAAARARLAPLTIARAPETDEYLLALEAAPEAPHAPRGSSENAQGAKLLATGDYDYIRPDWRCYLQSTSTNDPGLPQQWHHTQLNSTAAWDLVTGSTAVTIALVDTGIDLTHPDLAPRRVSGYNSASHLAETAGGQVNDIVGHGTHVAGCAAAIGNNGVGVCGTAWSLSIMMVRTTNDSWGTAFVWDILEGARWAADHGAKVVSVSYAGIQDPTVQTTGAYIRSKGALLLFAADNTSTNHSSFDWPDVLVVGALDSADQIPWFSSFGRAVDVYAPGVSIYSTKRWAGYEYRDGTSMATPLVAGIAGLIYSISPSFTPAQVESFITSSCVDLGPTGNDELFGWGRVNSFGAVKKALGATGPRPPTAQPDSADAVGAVPVLIDVLENDYDVNDDAITLSLLSEYSSRGAVLSRSRATGPGGRDQILYSPPAALSGTDTFSYRIGDTTGRTAVGHVTVHVTPHCAADLDFSGYINADDYDLFILWFSSADRRADMNRDGFVNANDFDAFMLLFDQGC